jgi:hypothetical protein
MKIKFLKSIASSAYAYDATSDPVEWKDAAEAARFIERGIAVAVPGGAERAAVAPSVERAIAMPQANKARR